MRAFLPPQKILAGRPWLQPAPTTHTSPFSGLTGRAVRQRGAPSALAAPHIQALPLQPRPHHLLPTGEATTWGTLVSPGAPATPIRQKARFKIRDAKCHLRPRSREPAKEAPRQLLLGEWATRYQPTQGGVPVPGSQGPAGRGLLKATPWPLSPAAAPVHCRPRWRSLGRWPAGSGTIVAASPGVSEPPEQGLPAWLSSGRNHGARSAMRSSVRAAQEEVWRGLAGEAW